MKKVSSCFFTIHVTLRCTSLTFDIKKLFCFLRKTPTKDLNFIAKLKIFLSSNFSLKKSAKIKV